MINELKQDDIHTSDYLGCMGEFNMSNVICKKLCSISLRCIIEHNQSMQTELLEELLASNDALLRIQ
ncbi:MAG: hypothetical protein KJ737_01160 [Proteobacteria bacterium]|nr:hypothetical protein [Pseudomonadota bacterium]